MTAGASLAARVEAVPRTQPRIYSRISLGVAAVHSLLSAFVIFRGFFYVDDYIFLSRATLNPALSDGMLEPWAGHVMPGGLLLTWVMAHAAPLNYTAFATVIVVAQIACTFLFRAVALRLFGPGAAHAISVSLYASSMAILAASSWWASAINALPMQIGMLCALLLTSGSRARTVPRDIAAIGVIVASLFFFEKSLLIPVVLLGVEWARSSVSNPLRALLGAITGRKAFWTGVGALIVGYLALYSASGASEPLNREDYSALRAADIVGRSFPTLAGDLLGGPWRWQINFEAFQDVTPMSLILTVQIITLGFAIGAALRGPGFWSWTVVGLGYVAATLTLLFIGRSGAGSLLVSAPRYFTDTALVLSLASGGALSTCRAPEALFRKARVGLVSGTCGALVLSALASVGGILEWLDGNASRRYVSGSADDLHTLTEPTEILDIPVPETVIGALVHPLNRASSVFGLVNENATFTRQMDGVRFLDPSGRLSEGRVAGVATPEGPEPGCGWKFVGAGLLRIPATPSVGAVSLTYTSDRDTAAAISVGGEPVTISLNAGEHQTTIAVDGQGEAVGIKTEDPQATICVKALVAGWPLPD